MKLFELKLDILTDFMKSLSQKEIKFYSIRDNCGQAALDFIDFAKKQGIELHRVRGYFKADSIVYDKADFTSVMKKEFKDSGLNFNLDSDRKKWIEQSKYFKEYHEIPHYWTIDSKNKIYDPSGYLQFVNTGLSKDLNKSRYFNGKLV